MRSAVLVLLTALALGPAPAAATTPDADDSLLQAVDVPVAVRLQAELGTVGQVSHRLQFGADGTEVRVPRDLGQDVLYPFARFQLDLDLGANRRNTLALLYQPLSFRSTLAPSKALQVGDLTFPRGEALEFRYGFPFYRATWLSDLAASNDIELAVGLGLQIRNANIVYTSVDGSQSIANRNIGPVPLLAWRSRSPLKGDWWVGTEAQGFWAPIRLLNGSAAADVEGLILDGNARLGLARDRGADFHVTVRYIGGGAVGTSSNPDPFTDGYTLNWLHFAALSLGASLR